MSLSIQEQISLRPYNTLAIDVAARFFVAVQSLEQLQEALAWAEQREIPRPGRHDGPGYRRPTQAPGRWA